MTENKGIEIKTDVRLAEDNKELLNRFVEKTLEHMKQLSTDRGTIAVAQCKHIMENTVEKMEETYPKWSNLTDKEKQIVSDIASQCPMCCEDVAAIFIENERSIIETAVYIKRRYGFTVF